MPNFEPGALYSDTCPCHTDQCTQNEYDASENCCEKVKVFEIALVQAKVIYNSFGWNDLQGRFFVMKEELEKHGGLDS